MTSLTDGWLPQFNNGQHLYQTIQVHHDGLTMFRKAAIQSLSSSDKRVSNNLVKVSLVGCNTLDSLSHGISTIPIYSSCGPFLSVLFITLDPCPHLATAW